MNKTDFHYYLAYEPHTGYLIKIRPHSGRRWVVGEEAGNIRIDGRYKTFVLHRRRHYVHRVVWEMMHGPIPDGLCIDHINGNGLDNRLENLRLTTRSGNQKNKRLHKNNTTGLHGVTRVKNGFVVACDGKYIKHIKDFFEACCLRKSAELRTGYHPNHGKEMT